MSENQSEGVVLLVDDEEAILESLGELLDACGFKVFTADGYDPAVKILQERSDEIEAIISYVKMPGKAGLDVLRYVNVKPPLILKYAANLLK